jgi:hypothetical protein
VNVSLEHPALKELIEKRVGDSRETRSGFRYGGERSIGISGLQVDQPHARKLLLAA